MSESDPHAWPGVVIDPEDREQITRLLQVSGISSSSGDVDRMQEALRCSRCVSFVSHKEGQ